MQFELWESLWKEAHVTNSFVAEKPHKDAVLCTKATKFSTPFIELSVTCWSYLNIE